MVQLAFVTLGRGAGPLTAAAVSDTWRRTWPNEAPLEQITGTEGSLAFPFMGGTGMVGYMPAPVPWKDLEGPAQCAWHWPQAVEVLKVHQSHLIVGIAGKAGPPKFQAIKLTLLTAAVCAATRAASGVYWGGSTSVSPADRFIHLAREMTPDSLPLLSWVEFRVFPSDQRSCWSVFTTGLEALGLMEIEVRDARGSPDELVGLVMDIAGYLTQPGVNLKNGDTIGLSAEQKLRAHHVPSAWARAGNVLWIEM